MTGSTRPLLFCLALSPLFLLTLGGWVSAVLFVSSGLALWLLACAGQAHGAGRDQAQRQATALLCLTVLFASPAAAILLGQAFRHSFAWRDYDSPARFLLCIPILLVIVKRRLDAVRYFTAALPGAMLITLLAVALHPDAGWVKDRISTYFVDPLTFGSLSLTLGLLSLLSVDLYGPDPGPVRLYKLLGFAAGMYLSILSGSRTGWAAVPFVLLYWLGYKLPRYRVLTLLGVALLSVAVYFISGTVQQRIDEAAMEFLSYQWNAPNPQTSIGDRLSIYRIAAFLFSQNPLGGFGDHGFSALLGQVELNRFAMPETQKLALNAGFHNEIATNMVRSGVWGLLSSMALFAAPAVFFLRSLSSADRQTQRIALFALSYLTCTFISAMTTEVFNLKFTASFHALALTVLIGSLLVRAIPGEAAP